MHAFFYRTSAGAEIDLLLEVAHEQYWAIEIKLSQSPTLQKGFYIACDDLNISQRFVVCPGQDPFLLREGVVVLPLVQMMEKVQAL